MTSQTIAVSHLGSIKAGCAISNNGLIDRSKPVVVMVNSMYMTAALYADQFDDEDLTKAANLVAIEPLGHGATSCASDHFTYWDSAIMALQVMDALGVEAAYALGTSQGGWIVARMALLAPERVRGLLLLGTSMDYESEDSRAKGCWDPAPLLTPFLERWAGLSEAGESDFVMDEELRRVVSSLGFGEHGTPDKVAFWEKRLQEVYRGGDGRRKAKMALVSLLTRDGLLMRLGDIKCPVHWLQGSEDVPYGTAIAAEQIKLFTGAPRAELTIVQNGSHYLNATNPRETSEAVLKMLGSPS